VKLPGLFWRFSGWGSFSCSSCTREKPYICSTVKKLGAYFFLFIFLYNSMGNFLVYELNKEWLKKEMRTYIRSKSQSERWTVLRIFRPETHPDLRRIESRELLYKGHLYDIARETRDGDITTFYCIPDVKEELLIAGFKKVQNGKMTQALRYHLITQALPVFAETRVGFQAIQVLFRDLSLSLPVLFPDLTGHPPELS
jgi:hypothetical protein